MDIIVCAKQVVDVSEVKIDEKTKKPLLDGVGKKISDIDKNAMEEALKIKEKFGGKITVLTLGPPEAKENIKELLAVGGDEAIIVKATGQEDYYAASILISKAIEKLGSYDLILCGEASIDQFSGQMGPRIAGLLNIPQITYAQKVDAQADSVTVEKNLGDSVVIMQSSYPVLITVTKEINEPRLPSLMQILASSNKPIHEWDAPSLVETSENRVEIVEIKGLTTERKNIVLEGEDMSDMVAKVVDAIIKEGALG
jgi:electron transfer flavoprotein beta subunit